MRETADTPPDDNSRKPASGVKQTRADEPSVWHSTSDENEKERWRFAPVSGVQFNSEQDSVTAKLFTASHPVSRGSLMRSTTDGTDEPTITAMPKTAAKKNFDQQVLAQVADKLPNQLTDSKSGSEELKSAVSQNLKQADALYKAPAATEANLVAPISKGLISGDANKAYADYKTDDAYKRAASIDTNLVAPINKGLISGDANKAYADYKTDDAYKTAASIDTNLVAPINKGLVAGDANKAESLYKASGSGEAGTVNPLYKPATAATSDSFKVEQVAYKTSAIASDLIVPVRTVSEQAAVQDHIRLAPFMDQQAIGAVEKPKLDVLHSDPVIKSQTLASISGEATKSEQLYKAPVYGEAPKMEPLYKAAVSGEAEIANPLYKPAASAAISEPFKVEQVAYKTSAVASDPVVPVRSVAEQAAVQDRVRLVPPVDQQAVGALEKSKLDVLHSDSVIKSQALTAVPGEANKVEQPPKPSIANVVNNVEQLNKLPVTGEAIKVEQAYKASVPGMANNVELLNKPQVAGEAIKVDQLYKAPTTGGAANNVESLSKVASEYKVETANKPAPTSQVYDVGPLYKSAAKDDSVKVGAKIEQVAYAVQDQPRPLQNVDGKSVEKSKDEVLHSDLVNKSVDSNALIKNAAVSTDIGRPSVISDAQVVKPIGQTSTKELSDAQVAKPFIQSVKEIKDMPQAAKELNVTDVAHQSQGKGSDLSASGGGSRELVKNTEAGSTHEDAVIQKQQTTSFDPSQIQKTPLNHDESLLQKAPSTAKFDSVPKDPNATTSVERMQSALVPQTPAVNRAESDAAMVKQGGGEKFGSATTSIDSNQIVSGKSPGSEGVGRALQQLDANKTELKQYLSDASTKGATQLATESSKLNQQVESKSEIKQSSQEVLNKFDSKQITADSGGGPGHFSDGTKKEFNGEFTNSHNEAIKASSSAEMINKPAPAQSTEGSGKQFDHGSDSTGAFNKHGPESGMYTAEGGSVKDMANQLGALKSLNKGETEGVHTQVGPELKGTQTQTGSAPSSQTLTQQSGANAKLDGHGDAASGSRPTKVDDALAGMGAAAKADLTARGTEPINKGMNPDSLQKALDAGGVGANKPGLQPASTNGRADSAATETKAVAPGPRADLGSMKSDVAALKADPGAIKSDATALPASPGTVLSKTDGPLPKGDPAVLKADVAAVKGNLTALKNDGSLNKVEPGLKTEPAVRADGATLKGDTAAKALEISASGVGGQRELATRGFDPTKGADPSKGVDGKGADGNKGVDAIRAADATRATDAIRGFDASKGDVAKLSAGQAVVTGRVDAVPAPKLDGTKFDGMKIDGLKLETLRSAELALVTRKLDGSPFTARLDGSALLTAFRAENAGKTELSAAAAALIRNGAAQRLELGVIAPASAVRTEAAAAASRTETIANANARADAAHTLTTRTEGQLTNAARVEAQANAVRGEARVPNVKTEGAANRADGIAIKSEAGKNGAVNIAGRSDVPAAAQSTRISPNSSGRGGSVHHSDNVNGAAPGARVPAAFVVSGQRGGALGGADSRAALGGRRIDSTGGKLYITGVELAVIGALVAIAKNRASNVSRTMDGRTGTAGPETLVSSRRIDFNPDRSTLTVGGAKGFPARELSLAAILALTGTAKDRQLENPNEPVKNAIRIERSIDLVTRRKEEASLVPGPNRARKEDIAVPPTSREPASIVISTVPDRKSEPEQDSKEPESPLPGFQVEEKDQKEDGFTEATRLARYLQDVSEKERGATEDKATEETEKSNQDESGNGSKVLYRPTWLINKGETLVSIAEKFLGDANLGWLIADLNRDKLTEYFEDNKRIIEVRSREKLELPVPEDITTFYDNKPRHADPDNLITIVIERQLDLQVVNSQLDALLGGLRKRPQW